MASLLKSLKVSAERWSSKLLTAAAAVLFAALLFVTFSISGRGASSSGSLVEIRWDTYAEPRVEEYVIEGVSIRKRSLGLEDRVDELGHQCSRAKQPPWTDPKAGSTDRKEAYLQYTPNRAWPEDPEDARAAWMLVVSNVKFLLERLAWERPDGRNQSRWDSWKEFYFSAARGTASLVLIVSNKAAKSTREIADPLHLEPANCNKFKSGCEWAAGIDDGYDIYLIRLPELAKPVLVFITLAAFPDPWWAVRQNETEDSLVAKHWKSQGCNYGYTYTKYCEWLGTGMFDLHLLRYFDYVHRIDDDIAMRWSLERLEYGESPFAWNLAKHKVVFFHAGMNAEPPECARNVNKLVGFYLDIESSICRHLVRGMAEGQEWYDKENGSFYGNFMGLWLGLFTSPEVTAFKRLYHDFPFGSWENRWGDQQFVTKVVGMFDDGKNVKDYSYLRGPIISHKD